MLAATWWFINMVPHKASTDHTEWYWGFVHGALMLPSLLWELIINRQAAIYQSPNSGRAYDFFYFVGMMVVYGRLFLFGWRYRSYRFVRA